MSQYTTGREVLADLEKRVALLEGELKALKVTQLSDRQISALVRQQLDERFLVSKSPDPHPTETDA